MQSKFCLRLALLCLLLGTAGCGGFVARRIAQAPNTYPSWLAPHARVELAFGDKFFTNFPAHFVEVGPPTARLRYRLVEPADYHLKVSETNWVERGKPNFKFSFKAVVPGKSNIWTTRPRGTVVLLHGYGEAEFAMAPWALRLAEAGWRCVLLDLRGHGKSTGRRIYFGLKETHDLSQLLDTLAHDSQLAPPVAALGESYGAAIALRWKTVEPRVKSVVAIAPYAVLSNAVLNICREYAAWLPHALLNSGLQELPSLLEVRPAALNTTTVLARHPVVALFVAGSDDKITPVADVRKLYAEAAPGSELIVVPGATHESLPYFFSAIAPSVIAWLQRTNGSSHAQLTKGTPN